MKSLAAVVLIAASSLAHADPPTQILGSVRDPGSKRALEGATVTIDAPDGTRAEMLTDEHGLYHFRVPAGGTYRVSFRFGDSVATQDIAVPAGRFSQLDATLPQPGEIITIHDTPPPVPAKPITSVHKLPPYSDQLAMSDSWLVQWTLLDVDEKGRVARFKYLDNLPSPDIDEVAKKYVFGLKFTPAEDGHGRAIHALVVWKIEWPSYWWLVETTGVTTYMPSGSMPIVHDHPPRADTIGNLDSKQIRNYDARATVPCLVDGTTQRGLEFSSHHKTYRDCSKPNLDSADVMPWIAR